MTKGICKYCGQEKELCKAHIIPKSFYKLAENKTFWGVSSDGRKDLKTCQNGFKDCEILCSDCDNIIGKYDDYAYKVFYSELLQYRRYGTPLFLMTNNQFDYKKLRLFFISLLWRASISKTDACSMIQLGEKYENLALRVLKGEIPDQEDLFHPIVFKKTDANKLSDVAMITRGKYSGQIKYSFIAPGYIFDCIVNTTPIKNDWVIKSLSLNKNELAVIETDFDVTKAWPPPEYLKKFFKQ